MIQYVELHVSLKETKRHVLDEASNRVWRGRCTTDPAAIAATLRRYAPSAARIGLETGPLTTWLFWTALTAKGLPWSARHAKKALDMKVNKTDANDPRDWRIWCVPPSAMWNSTAFNPTPGGVCHKSDSELTVFVPPRARDDRPYAERKRSRSALPNQSSSNAEL
jgi:hypothetical protein